MFFLYLSLILTYKNRQVCVEKQKVWQPLWQLIEWSQFHVACHELLPTEVSIFEVFVLVVYLQAGCTPLLRYLQRNIAHQDVVEAFLRCNADVYITDKARKNCLAWGRIHVPSQPISNTDLETKSLKKPYFSSLLPVYTAYLKDYGSTAHRDMSAHAHLHPHSGMICLDHYLYKLFVSQPILICSNQCIISL